jgi:Asp-tRNA(Asn)/Glu-tRNA(Gln) amidotransferase A subunit family amidase
VTRTAVETISAVQSGELTPAQVVEESLARIEALDHDLQAWVTVDAEGAREAANYQGPTSGWQPYLGESELLARHRPLAGLTVGIKDIIDVAGLRTGLGAEWAAFTPQADAVVVKRLKDAGAIIMGKTHTTQFAASDPAPTTNPWNQSHTPGGSSSGSAAAVAAGMVPIALGTQTVGSMLRPAAYCGIVGLKPTHGRISTTGVFPFASSFDHVGIFGRRVEDTALILNVLAGYDPGDLFSQDVAVDDYFTAARNPKPPVVLLPRRYYRTAAEDEIAHHVDAIADMLAASGATVKEVDIPAEPDDFYSTGRIIQAGEAAAAHATLFEQFRDSYRPLLKEVLIRGSEMPAALYVKATSQVRYIRRALLDILKDGDVLLMASAPTTAPLGLNSTGSPILCAPASFTGLPSISLPSGIGIGGLPLAIQLVAPHWQETRLLSAAAWVEKELGFDKTPPL